VRSRTIAGCCLSCGTSRSVLTEIALQTHSSLSVANVPVAPMTSDGGWRRVGEYKAVVWKCEVPRTRAHPTRRIQ
jgi:hypothetical protein